MKTKPKKVYSIKLTGKNTFYLGELGFINRRTKLMKDNEKSFNRFINECITYILESGSNGYSSAVTPEELHAAYINHLRKSTGRRWEKLGDKMEKLTEASRKADQAVIEAKKEKVYAV